ncbi:LysM peptidoglycan-binding domain-containing protein [Phyllobacterium sp. OV277]|uniref:LysM peptidoglycan-binding domain-containing protein n=1 Tax=Phyllobacterium sp. OV277 TaxID=1882772 RepID=UPI00087F5E38|nr:LysM peptidoglycan-binding domain-containing protein [Phyllobacterium sp. OV277]SDO98150.1 Nucleoid-associated protein YgaU, contains BON and LysM domains [Phyllobacterium sp. OV277]
MIKNKFALLGFGVVVALGLVAAYLGFVPGKPTPGAPVVTADGTAPAPAAPKPAETAQKPAEQPQIAAPAPATSADATTPAAGTAPAPANASPAKPGVPAFDVLRVDPKGTIVIAGKAANDGKVDLLARGQVIGSTKASPSGEFVIVLDDPLKPGDYQLVLRSTAPDGSAMTSLETAIVSIPETKSGQVLALVEQSGQPSRMITKPEVPAQAALNAPATTAAPTGDKPVKQPTAKARIVVEAVEIEGSKLFIAGIADAGSTVKVYANDDLIGSTKTGADGHFLVQTTRDLPVGDYIIRADMVEKDGVTVIARAAVPFKREAGERVSAIAPAPATEAPAPAPQASTETAPAAGAEQAQSNNTGAALKNVDGSVIIRRGDNLWTISRRTYGEGTRYTTIYLANKEQIQNPDVIFPGQVFALPEKDKTAPQ